MRALRRGPRLHHATQGDALGIKPLSAFCARQKGMMGLLLTSWKNSPKTQQSFGDGRPHDPSSVWHGLLSSGFRAETARSVVSSGRLNAAPSVNASDFALVKTPEDVQRALECNWRSVFAVSDSSIASLAPKAFEGGSSRCRRNMITSGTATSRL